MSNQIDYVEQIDALLNAEQIGPCTGNQFGRMADKNVVAWLGEATLSKKFRFDPNSTSAHMTLGEYRDHIKNNQTNCYSIGTSFEFLFISFVLNNLGFDEFKLPFALFSSIYENVCLAGYTKSRGQLMQFLTGLNTTVGSMYNQHTLVHDFITLVEREGFVLAENDLGWDAESVAQHCLIVCALNKIRSFQKTKRSVPSELIELAQGFTATIPLINLARAMTRGDLSWNYNIPLDELSMKSTCPEAYEIFTTSNLYKFVCEEVGTVISMCSVAARARQAVIDEREARDLM